MADRFGVGSLKIGGLSDLGRNSKDDLEPYWRDETNWLYTVEFLPTDDPGDWMLGADIIGLFTVPINCSCSVNYVAISERGKSKLSGGQ